MARLTSFRFRLDPTPVQESLLWRHAGAARFGFNTCLGMVIEALDARRGGLDAGVIVPWSGFDLINAFNRWKRSTAAGRVMVVDTAGVTVVRVGLAWRGEVSQQVFEEAAVDLGRGLAAFSDSRRRTRQGRRMGFPRFKKKARTTPSFRLRNKTSPSGRGCIRVGEGTVRSLTMPKIGTVNVREDTRRLRRMLRTGRATVLSVTVTYRGGCWYASVTVQAADLHPDRCHPVRPVAQAGGWIGVDRGLRAFVVAADAAGREVVRTEDPPRPLRTQLARQRRLARALARTQKGSKNHGVAVARLNRHHTRVRNVRKHFLDQVANQLVKNHDRLVLEDLNVAGMLRNHRLARAIADAGWAELARIITYRQDWHHGHVMLADRWFPSTKTCSRCGHIRAIALAEREFHCPACGFRRDRDVNAAINLAVWGEKHHA